MSLRRVVRTPEQWPRIVEVAHALGEQLPEAPDSRALADFLSSPQGCRTLFISPICRFRL